jgi:NADPH2:quinone reductase
MRAIIVPRHGGPDVLTPAERDRPVPGPGQILVETRAIGVNPVEAKVRQGLWPDWAPPLPYVPGYEAAGLVRAVGPGVDGFAPGDRVFGNFAVGGTYAELALFGADWLRPLPDRVSFAQGACVAIAYVTAYRALVQLAKARPGETVLVHGASGGVGTAAVQIARAAGLQVVGTAGTAAGRALVLREGAHHVVDHGAADSVDQIRAATGGRGPDIILEMMTQRNLNHDLALLAYGGRIALVANTGRIDLDLALTSRTVAIFGVSLVDVPVGEIAQALAAVGAGLEAGTLRPVVAREFPLAEAAAAHRVLEAGGALGNLVLVP